MKTIKVSPRLTQEEQTDNDNQQNIKTVPKSSNNHTTPKQTSVTNLKQYFPHPLTINPKLGP